MWDVLLLSVWTEPVLVSPSYQLIRDEITRRARHMAREKLAPFFARHSERAAEYGDMIRYQNQYPFCPGLLSIAAVLRTAGFTVRCVSLDVAREQAGTPAWFEQTIAQLAAQTTLAVGVSAVTPEINRALRVLDEVKRVRPDLKTMIGGTHVTYCDEAAAGHPAVDVVVRGEGEETTVELLQRWAEGKPFDDVRGITAVIGSTLVRTASRPLLDLATLPMPAYDCLDAETRDRVHITPTFSRGCPFECNYCVESIFWSRRVRYKDPECFADELEFIADTLNWRFIHVADSTFGLDREVTAAFCDALEQRQLDAMLSINVRPDVFTYLGEPLVRRLISLNVVEFYIGMETADADLLHSLDRRQKEETLRSALVRLKELGVPFVKVYVVVGWPGDTHAALQHTINQVRSFLDEGLIYYATGKYFVPAPGTVHASGDSPLQLKSRDWDRYERYNFPPIVEHEGLSAFELEQYLHLLQAVQLGHYRKLVPDETEYERVREWTAAHYLPRVYL
jgi:radical SAM superfamily enzyme YgiQ (UPF0313 family)